MNRLLHPRLVLAISLSYMLPAAAQDGGVTSVPDDGQPPVTIRVLQDIEINALYENPITSEGAEPASRYSIATLGLRKDQQFQMIDIHLEGGCEIQFEGEQYSLISCPWLPGFRDHREDIFMVMKNL